MRSFVFVITAAATLTCLDARAETFGEFRDKAVTSDVQEVHIEASSDHAVDWERHGHPADDQPSLEFTAGEAKSMKVDLMFDSFEEGAQVTGSLRLRRVAGNDLTLRDWAKQSAAGQGCRGLQFSYRKGTKTVIIKQGCLVRYRIQKGVDVTEEIAEISVGDFFVKDASPVSGN